MTKIILFCIVALMHLAGIAHASPKIIAGPIANPGNGHDYYLLAPDTWTASESAAQNLAGTLAIIRNTAEQEWVFSTFAAYGGTNRNLWIGLYRVGPERTLAWATGEELDYVNWAGGQPDDTGGREGFVFIASAGRPWGFPPGSWNDYTDSAGGAGDPLCGVVEVLGKSNPASLTTEEKALIGTWYEHGDRDRPCWITGTENLLFAIDHNRGTSRLLSTAKNTLYASNWVQHGDVVKDRILWSKGNWWSREPVTYK
jgi:hypothetical protein